MPKTIATLFTGYDLFGMGAKQAGYVNVFGLDIHEPAVEFCHRNNNTSVVCGDVRSHDYRNIKADLFHFSPECKSFSNANSEGSETEQDREFARATVRAIAESNPVNVSLENVTAYANSDSFNQIILPALGENYYYWMSNYCTADFGVPQTRDRLILRAIRKDQNRLLVPVVPPTHSKYPEDGLLPWVSWYDAIADIIPNLKPIGLTNWQKRSLDEQGFDITGQTVLISKDGSRKKEGYEHTFALVIPKDSPAPTIKAMGHSQHCQQYTIVIDGDVFRVSTKALARWQTVPDDCVFSGVNYIDCMGIGNGVPSLFAQRIVESFDLPKKNPKEHKMKRTLKIIYEQTVELDADDFSMTESEIDNLADLTVHQHGTPNLFATVVDYAWDEKPIPKAEIPEQFFMQVNGRFVATDGKAMITKECPIVPDMGVSFAKPTENIKNSLGKYLDVDFNDLPLHLGWFAKSLEGFKKLPNLEVRGTGEYEPGYFISNGTLLAVIAPVKILGSNTDSAVCFNADKAIA